MTLIADPQTARSTVTVYTKPACGQCIATKKTLDRMGVDYRLIDISKDDAAMAYVQELGARSAPVVVTSSGWWAGFDPERLAEIAPAS